LQIGAQESAPEENVEAALETLAQSVAPVSADYAEKIRALIVEKSVPRIEERLMELEEALLDSLLASSGKADSIRDDARALASGADDKSRARAEQAHLRRLARERFALPRLTLFS
jgi:3-methyladenine DNA glycosylase/8-oxoguanine DNA glycosylase